MAMKVKTEMGRFMRDELLRAFQSQKASSEWLTTEWPLPKYPFVESATLKGLHIGKDSKFPDSCLSSAKND